MNKRRLELSIFCGAPKSSSQERITRAHVCSLSASLAWHLLPGFIVNFFSQAPTASAIGHHQGPPPTPSARRDRGRPFPRPQPQAQCYLVLQLPILKEPQLILAFQIVSINVAEVYLKTETGVYSDPWVLPTSNNLPVPVRPEASRAPPWVLTPWPSALVKPGPILPEVLKN